MLLAYHIVLFLGVLDTVDFICTRGRCVFRTCKEEKDRVIFQIVSPPTYMYINMPD